MVTFAPMRRRPIVALREPVLGTTLTISLQGVRSRRARAIEAAVVTEIERLEQCFSAYRTDSELRRWGRGEIAEPSTDLGRLLTLGTVWQARTGGVFNPAVQPITDRWRLACAEGVMPTDLDLSILAQSIRAPRYDETTQHGDCSMLTFNALAKGLVIDRAAERAVTMLRRGSVTIEIGGDLVHRGDRPTRVAVENPLRPFDNEPPLCIVEIDNQAMATSGSARRGVKVGDRWFSHVIDPRTGWPVDHVASASVIAPDATTADAAATMLSVVTPAAGIAWANRQPEPIACLIISTTGEQFANGYWQHQLVG